MGTRSEIYYYTDGRLYRQYCQFDGYVEHVGKTLFKHYQDVNKIKKLLSLGDLHSLHAKLEPTTSGHTFDNPEKGVTVSYDRGYGQRTDRDVFYKAGDFLAPNVKDTMGLLNYVEKVSAQGYLYVYVEKDKTWYFIDVYANKTSLLSKALGLKEPVTSKASVGKVGIKREHSVNVARYLRKNKDYIFLYDPKEIGDKKESFIKADDYKKGTSGYIFNWVLLEESLNRKITQAELADYIYKKINGWIK